MNCGRHKCQYVLFIQCNLCQLAEVSEDCFVPSSVRTVTVLSQSLLCMNREIWPHRFCTVSQAWMFIIYIKYLSSVVWEMFCFFE